MSKKRRKWKYEESAKKKRYCERCEKRLKKSEARLCQQCYLEMASGNLSEVKHEIE